MTATRRPTVCCCSIAFRAEPLEAIIPKLADLGYDGVEVFAGHLDGMSDSDLDRIHQQADACNVSVT
jgi:sugar phosphate isomerase/epimerase